MIFQIMAKDWFRKTSWDEADQADFFAHLKRSRGADNKAQYLRIQAWHLEETGSAILIRAALPLLDKILSEFPNTFELAMVYKQKASCLAWLGCAQEAIEFYRLALDTERKNPKMGTRAWIEFGLFVCENNLTALFDEVIKVLDEKKSDSFLFAVDIYQSSGIRAIIAAHRGNYSIARNFAKTALAAAAETKSGFRYHPTVGLVQDKETSFFKSVSVIAES